MMKRFKIAPILLTAVLLGWIFIGCDTSEKRYMEAEALMSEGNFEEAAYIFERLEGYRDAAERASEATKEDSYRKAEELMGQGDYQKALSEFEKLKNFRDSKAKAEELAGFIIPYAEAQRLFANEEYEEALAAFEALGDYEDSETLAGEARDILVFAAAEADFQATLDAGTIRALDEFLERWDDDLPEEIAGLARDRIDSLKADKSLSDYILDNPDEATDSDIDFFLLEFPGHVDCNEVEDIRSGDILGLLEKGSITTEITGTQNKYIAWINVEIYNNTSHKLSVTIPNGVYFETSTANMPNMVVCGEQTVSARADGSGQERIRAYSMTITTKLPGTDVKYSAKRLSNARLEQVIEALDAAGAGEHVGLAAIWFLSGNYSDNAIKNSWIYEDGTGMISSEELASAKEIVREAVGG